MDIIFCFCLFKIDPPKSFTLDMCNNDMPHKLHYHKAYMCSIKCFM